MSAWDPDDDPPSDDPHDECIDCGVDQVGHAEPFGSYHAPGCAFYIADADIVAGQCVPCQVFFERFSCSALSHGECDCPRCQGLCHCTPPAS